MSLRSVALRGYGSNFVTGSIAQVATRGYIVTPLPTTWQDVNPDTGAWTTQGPSTGLWSEQAIDTGTWAVTPVDNGSWTARSGG